MARSFDLRVTDEEQTQSLLRPEAHSSRVVPWILSRLRALRRPARFHRVLLALKYALVAAIITVVLTPFVIPSYGRPPPHYEQLEVECGGLQPRVGCGNPHNETVFIASILHDKDGRLAAGPWGERLLSLIHILGPDNVFLSIYENDSGVAGQEALASLKRHVPCMNRIVSDERISLADFPNVTLPDGSQRTKRVAYLAELRNRALRPLDGLDPNTTLTRFDKILFLNDIVYRPLDAAHLLFHTNLQRSRTARWADRAGTAANSTHYPDYVAACALDFFEPHRMYDVYALRDADGYAAYQTLFPFFSRLGRGLSRADVLAQRDAVRVRSCWGGMMALQARFVQNMDPAVAESPSFTSIAGHTIDPDRPRRVRAPVRFRHEPEPFYDASECCLFSADLERAARREAKHYQAGFSYSRVSRGGHGDGAGGIFVNPFVRVAYDENVFRWIPAVQRFERLLRIAYDVQGWFMPAADNPWTWVEEGDKFNEEIWDGDRWTFVNRTGRSGLFCGVRDMQVMRMGGRPKVHGVPGTVGMGATTAAAETATKNCNGISSLKTNWVNTRMPPGQTMRFRTWWGEVLPQSWMGDYEEASREKRRVFFEKEYDES